MKESCYCISHMWPFQMFVAVGLGLKASAPSRVVTVSSAAAFFPEMLKMFENLSCDSFGGFSA